MAGTVTSNLTTITLAEAADSANWDDIGGGQGSGQNSDSPLEGLESRGRRVDNTVIGFSFDNTTTIDLSASNTHVGFWARVLQPGLIGVGGLEFRLGGAATATGSPWSGFTFTAADYPATGPWIIVWVDVSRTPDQTNGTLSTASVRQFGCEFDMGNVGGNAQNCLLDATRYTTSGLALSAGTSGSPATFSDLITADEINAYGIINEDFLNGPITIGGASSYFSDSNFALKAGAQPLSATGWITITADLTAATSEIFFGSGFLSGIALSFSGTSGTCDLGTVVVANAPATTLNSAVSWSGTYASSGTLTTNGANLDGVAVESGTDTIGVILTNTTDFNGGSISDCTTGLKLPDGAGPFTITGTQFSGNTTDIEVNSASDITVNMAGGANATTCSNIGAGNCTIVNAISYTITGMQAGDELTIVRVSDGVELFNVESSATGTEVYGFDGALSGTAVNVLVFNVADFEPVALDLSLPSSDSELVINQIADRVFDNPT